MEEGRIELTGEPVLHGIFFNSHVSRRDHVAVYVIRQFRQDRMPEAQSRDHRLRVLRCRRAAGGDHGRGRGFGSRKCSTAKRRIATWR